MVLHGLKRLYRLALKKSNFIIRCRENDLEYLATASSEANALEYLVGTPRFLDCKSYAFTVSKSTIGRIC